MIAKFHHMISLFGLITLVFFILISVSFGEDVIAPRAEKAPVGHLRQEFKTLVSEMKNKGHDVSKAVELNRRARKVMKEGRRMEARMLLNEAILMLSNIKSKAEGGQNGAVIEPQKTLAVSGQKSQTIKVDIGAEKVRVIDTFPFDVNTVSNNILQNFRYYELNTVKGVFRYYELNTVKGVLELNINFPVIVQEYPYTDFKFKNNKAFGATESSGGIKCLSDISRQGVILNLISQAGIGLARDFRAYDTRRPNIEPRKGTYDFSRSDYAVNVAIDKGIDFIGRLTLHHIRKKGGPPEDESAYVDYIKKTVKRYKGRVKYWQTLKEPEPMVRSRGGQDRGLSPEDAVRIFMLSYNTIKSVDENAIVYFPGTGPRFEFGGYNVDSYFEKIISLGGAKYFDVLGFDAYKYDIEEQAKKFRSILKKHGYDKPLWVAQTGAPTLGLHSQKRPYQGGGSHMAQCEFMVKAYASAFAVGAEKVFWGEFLDESLVKKNQDSKQRESESTGLVYAGSWSLKPGYFTHRLLASSLHNFTKAKKITLNIVKFTFANKSPVYIVWPN
jgi:hypothetical protein